LTKLYLVKKSDKLKEGQIRGFLRDINKKYPKGLLNARADIRAQDR
jgi:hypothetical protein